MARCLRHYEVRIPGCIIQTCAFRKHRIDLNLLYDHAPAALRSHAEDFVRALAEPDNINLFLSVLTDDDVTATLFPPPELPRTRTLLWYRLTLWQHSQSGQYLVRSTLSATPSALHCIRYTFYRQLFFIPNDWVD